MTLYQKMYYHLFNAITDALEKLDSQDYHRARYCFPANPK